jgi:phosphoinositide-3-kinase regulatory subunit 4
MGNQGSYRQAGNQPQQDPRTYFQIDLPKFVVNSKIGNGKFMKTYSVKVDGVLLVVKVYMKAPDEDLTLHSARFSKLWRTISPARYPNLLPYQMWIKSSTRMTKTNAIPIYVIRQYLYSNLHDRLSTRPFLNELEKLWLIYQLFKCVEVCHSHSIIHGDIKAENILCTTWNFLVLTDFAPHKPTMLPDDDPTDFQYYFDTMGRSSCYIAPERFYHREVRSGGIVRQASGLGGEYFSGSGEFTSVGESSNTMKVPLTTSMDVFSLGCTIAEVFMVICYLAS